MFRKKARQIGLLMFTRSTVSGIALFFTGFFAITFFFGKAFLTFDLVAIVISFERVSTTDY